MRKQQEVWIVDPEVDHGGRSVKKIVTNSGRLKKDGEHMLHIDTDTGGSELLQFIASMYTINYMATHSITSVPSV